MPWKSPRLVTQTCVTQTFVVLVFVAAGLSTARPLPAQTLSTPRFSQADEVYLFNHLSSLESNPVLIDALSLTDDQLKSLSQLGKESVERQQSAYATFRENIKTKGQREAQLEFARSNADRRDEYSKRFEQVLLDHQRDRLRQIIKQQTIRYRGWSGGPRSVRFNDPLSLPLQLASELELTPSEIRSLETEIESIRADMEAEIETLRQKAFQELLKKLSSDQRRDLDELVGDPFDFDRAQRKRAATIERKNRETGSGPHEQSDAKGSSQLP